MCLNVPIHVRNVCSSSCRKLGLLNFCIFGGGAIDWNSCVILQKNSSDALFKNCSDVLSVEVFRKLCQSMSTQVIRGLLNFSNNKFLAQKFNNSLLHHVHCSPDNRTVIIIII